MSKKARDFQKNDNVYSLVEKFYKNSSVYEPFIEQKTIEKYLRRKAWDKTLEEELCFIWFALETTLVYMAEYEIRELDTLGIYDHLEILYRLSEKEIGFTLSEDDTKHYYAIIREFYKYWLAELGDTDENVDEFIEACRALLYVKDVYHIPPRHDAEEFYSSLDTKEVIPPEDIDKLNQMLDALLKRVRKYFQSRRYQRDFERALALYTGPEEHIDDDWDTLSIHHEDFWQSFWDYFLFDYHLIDTDQIPLFVYFFAEEKNLTISEQDIVRDLLHSEFRIFYVTGTTEDVVNAHDLFTDELIEMPVSDWLIADYDHMIYFGHMHANGIMMLNYVTSLPASQKLRTRMKEILENELELFRCRVPEATLADFLSRESAAVRHILHIMSAFAQLNLLTDRKSKRRSPIPKKVVEKFTSARNHLALFALKIGFSCFAAKLLTNLFDDYICKAKIEVSPYELSSILTACIIAFGNLNGLHFENVSNIESVLGAPPNRVAYHLRGIEERLGCTMFDARYLVEEGFVFSLYYE